MTKEELAELIGEMPEFSSIPAAWWITTDQAQMDAYDRYKADYVAAMEKVRELERKLGADGAYIGGFSDSKHIVGFGPSAGMKRYGPDREPVPLGWRIDSKSGHLVPSRKTKADRESTAAAEFKAVAKIPTPGAYLTGMFRELYLSDRREGGGTIYSPQFARGAACVWAFCWGDPDRAERREFARHSTDVDESIWTRQKVSVLMALIEDDRERRKVTQ